MKENNKTQSEIAIATGITRPTLLSLIRNENQSIRYETINKLCDFFAIDMSDLLVYSPVDVELKDIILEKLPISIDGKIIAKKQNYLVSLIYKIDEFEIEFDTNLTVNETENNLKNSGRLFFNGLLPKQEWKKLQAKNFDENFIKTYNESIKFDEKIKNLLNENNLNTDFEIKYYQVGLHGMELGSQNKDELLEDVKRLLENSPLSHEEKEILLEEILENY